jgi:hypothetical protein
MFHNQRLRLLPVIALAAAAAAAYSQSSNNTAPIGGSHSPDRPVLRDRTPPADPIAVDPIGGIHNPVGEPDPVGRRIPPIPFASVGRGSYGFDRTWIGGGCLPADPILRRPTPPVDPVDVDPIGGNHFPGQPEPVRRDPPRGGFAGGLTSGGGVDVTPIGGGNSPADPILLDGGPFAFEPAVQFSISSHPMGTAVADLNGDGRVEIAVTSSRPDRVTILQNLGDGNFGRPIDVLLPDGSGPDQVVAGDFNGDGRLDLCVSLRNMDAVALLENERVFSGLPKIVSTGVQPSWLATGDFDVDGYLDLVVSNTGSGSITLLFNDGYANFKSEDIGVGVGPRALAVADFDGDSLLDVAVAVGGTHSIEVLRNFGDGVLKNGWTISTGRFVPEGLVASDLEGDGDVDICVSAAGADVDTMLTYLNAGFGAFDAGPVIEMEGTGNSGLAAGDFDLDQNFDLACVAASESIVSVWHNLGMARFSSYDEFAAGRAPVQVLAADLDGNESPDLVIVNRDADSISVLINMVNGIAGTPFCFGDGSGTACPARNAGAPGHGCDNAAGTGGALLYTSGAARVSNDTLTLDVKDLPRSTLIVFLQGTATLDRGFGVPFSNGLACLDGNVTVLGVRAPAQGTVQYPNWGEDKVSVIGLIPPGGGTRYYQVWYRDNFPPMTYQSYNSSNGVSVNWIP